MSSKLEAHKTKDVTVEYSNGVRATYSIPKNLEGDDILIYIMLAFGNKRMSDQKNFDHQKYIDLRNKKARVVEMPNQ
jgi:hypothetical protein